MRSNLKCLFVLMILCAVSIHAQRKPKIKGNRSVTEVNQSLPAFSSIEVKDDLVITLKRATAEGYSLIADDNLIDVLKFKVEDSTLVVSSFYQITAKKKLEIEISYMQLSSIMLQDGRLTSINKINSDELKIITMGTSRIEIGADAGFVKIDMRDNSAGNFTLTADSLSIDLKNKANANVYTNSFRNNFVMGDNTSLEIEGTADEAIVVLKGNSKFRSPDLSAKEMDLWLMDNAEARAYVSDYIVLHLQGSTRCYLYGDAEIDLPLFTDTSELLKRKK